MLHQKNRQLSLVRLQKNISRINPRNIWHELFMNALVPYSYELVDLMNCYIALSHGEFELLQKLVNKKKISI